MANTKKICKLDSDCDSNYICAFNEKDLSHYCINDDINDMYYGCLDVDNNYDIIDSKTNNEQNYKNCIDFSRRQINKDGIDYNYMIFKPKKNTYVDTTTINIYLKCEKEILAIIPYNDYFNLKCNEKQDECIMESKESLKNFIIQNSKNCIEKNLYFEIIYECENEGIKKNEIIKIDLNNFNNFKINLKCPIDSDNNKYINKCSSLYLNDNNINEINKDKSLYDCKNPVYTVPRIVNNINTYKKINAKNNNIKIQEYDNKINEKINDVKRLKAEKYIKLKEIENGEIISLDDAYNIIDKLPFERLINSNKENWILNDKMDAIENIISNDKYSSSINFYGLVYTIDDVIKISNQNNQNFFVWYNNTYELENFASKLYFVDIFNIDSDIINKNNWVKHDNVTTGIFRFQLEYFGDTYSFNDFSDTYYITGEDSHYLDSEEIKTANLINNSLLQKYIELNTNILDDNGLSTNVINKLNNQITTFGQAIEMNNYETTINNQILFVLSILALIIFAVFIVVIIYFNYKTAGKIKLFGKP